MTKLSVWLLASRPKTLFASIGPVILGLGLAQLHSQFKSSFIAILTLLCALLMQVGTNLVNDYFDSIKGIDNEKRLGPTRVTQQGLLSPREVQLGFRLVFLIAFILGIYLMYHGGLPIILIGLTSLLAAYAYTGGPYPLSYHGMGEIAAFIFFGPVAVWGTYFLQSGQVELWPFLIGAGPGFIAATIMAINNLRDRENDSQSGKKTLAVRLGQNGARLLCLIFVFLSSFIPVFTYFFLYSKPLLLIVIFLPYLFFKTWLKIYRGPIDQTLNQALANTGKYLFIYCLLFSLALIIS